MKELNYLKNGLNKKEDMKKKRVAQFVSRKYLKAKNKFWNVVINFIKNALEDGD